MNRLGVVKETSDGHDDNPPKSRLWEVVKERGEKRQNDENKETRYQTRGLCFCSGICVDSAAAKASCVGVGEEKGADDVGCSKGYELLVGADLVVVLSCGFAIPCLVFSV